MKIKKFIFLALLAVFFVNGLFCQSGRVEYELRYAIPDYMVDSVWQYLTSKYNNNNFFLKKMDTLFNTKMAEDVFTDQYFDDKNFQLLEAHTGVRHRIRNSLSDSKDKKNGRELVQIKISEVGSNEVTRAEFKYPVKHYKKEKKPFDKHPLIGLIKRKKRADFIGRLSEYGIVAQDLFPTIKLTQNRKRIYIYHDTLAFGTVTLDNANANYEDEHATFVELEMELNEVSYTAASPEDRLKMQQVNDRIKSDILTKFPKLKQDQTPKYNKAANRMSFNTSIFLSPLFFILYFIVATVLIYVFFRKIKMSIRKNNIAQ